MTTTLNPETQTWETIVDYLTEYPDSSPYYASLSYGHELNKGHRIDASIHRGPDGVIRIERKCC